MVLNAAQQCEVRWLPQLKPLRPVDAILPTLKEAGLVIGGLSHDKTLAETIELPDHPWFFASQFHPEFLSRPMKPHPLFAGFIKAAKEKRVKK